MAILCDEHNVLFLAVPRTASTALIKHLFIGRMGGREIPEQDICDAKGNLLCPSKHSTLDELIAHGVLDKQHAMQLRIVAGARNPLDSLISLYEKHRGRYVELLNSTDPGWVAQIPDSERSSAIASSGGMTQWLLRTWRPRQSVSALLAKKRNTLLHQRFLKQASDVLRFEQLDADLRVLLRNLGLPQSWAEIPNTNPTRERLDASIARYYNRVSFRLVLNAYYGSFERFGYPTRYNAYRA